MAAAMSEPKDKSQYAEWTLVHSGGKTPQLSNLFACEVEVGGVKYPSAEHAYQGRKCEDQDEWLVGGKYSDWDWVMARVNEGRKVPLSTKHWKAKNMIGILAKWVIKRPFMFGLKYITPTDSLEFHIWTVRESTWFPIFEGKFKGDLLDSLLKTEGQLVEFDRFAKSDTKWGGKIVDYEVVGQNEMGKLLTKFRDSKRPKRKREEEVEEPVKALKTMTQEQVIKAAFAKAAAEGAMIEIDQDLPDNWDDMDLIAKTAYAVTEKWTHAQWMEHVQPLLDAVGATAVAAPAPPEPVPVAMAVPTPVLAAAVPLPASSEASLPRGGAPTAYSSEASLPRGGAPTSSPAGLFSDDSDDEVEEGPIECSAAVATFSDAVESDASALAAGHKGNGYTYEELKKLRFALRNSGHNAYIYSVEDSLNTVTGKVLVVRDFYGDHKAVLKELCGIPEKYIDKKMWSFQQCKNKSRWNTNLTDRLVVGDIENPDPAKRVSSEVPFSDHPEIKEVRNRLTHLGLITGIGGLKDLLAEINFYGPNKALHHKPEEPPGIGPHIDGERKKVVALNLGAKRILRLCAFNGIQPTGYVTEIALMPGDLYIFDEVAAGVSYRGNHIRHWASAGRADGKYMNKIDTQLKRKLCAKRDKIAKKGEVWVMHPEARRIADGGVRTVSNKVE